jgi:hypothetical protein
MRAPLRFFPLRRNRAALALLGALALACMIAAAAITVQVLIRLEAYGTADTDNLQWTISQLEVDQMRFRLALGQLDPADPGAPEVTRRSFDLLYSRAMTLRTSPTYRDVLAAEPARTDMRTIIDLLGEMLPVIDSTDAAILNGRARLTALAARMTAPIRALGPWPLTRVRPGPSARRSRRRSSRSPPSALPCFWRSSRFSCCSGTSIATASPPRQRPPSPASVNSGPWRRARAFSP